MTADKDEGHAWNGRDDPADGEEVGSDHEHSGRDELDHEGVPHVPPVPAGPAGGSARGVEKATGRALEEAQDPLPDVDDSSDLRAVVEERSAFWAGPLPEPSTLRAYDEIVPGAAERIIRVHESQTVRVADREDRIISAEIELAGMARAGRGSSPWCAWPLPSSSSPGATIPVEGSCWACRCCSSSGRSCHHGGVGAVAAPSPLGLKPTLTIPETTPAEPWLVLECRSSATRPTKGRRGSLHGAVHQ